MTVEAKLHEAITTAGAEGKTAIEFLRSLLTERDGVELDRIVSMLPPAPSLHEPG